MAPISSIEIGHGLPDTEAPSVLQGQMDDMITTAKPAKRTRADAVRNRERVLDAAKLVFNAGGAEASLEAVARKAGVGIGTLYRHFPTRESLFEAVYRREVEQLADLADRLQAEAEPVDGLSRWMHAAVDFVATKKGMSAALAVSINASSPLVAFSSERLTHTIEALLRRPVEDGALRPDVGGENLLRALVGFCYTHDGHGWQEGVHRLIDVLIDGLRRR